jgi:CHASE2 domain-containing sensor protein
LSATTLSGEVRAVSRGSLAKLAAVAVVSSLAALAADRTGIGEGLELESVDARFSIRGEQPPPADVVLVVVDEQTLDQLDLRWPFPRSRHARVIRRVAAAKPSAIAVDLQFTERTKDAEDNALIESIAASGDVVLGTTVVDDQGATNVLGGDEVVSSVGARVGTGLMPPDADGALRRVPYAINGLESFAVVAAEVATHRQVLPFDERRTWIDYAGPPGTLRAYPYADVLRGRVPAESFRGKVVVIGTEASRLKDVSPTSTTAGELMSGPEIQGNAIATVLDGLPLRSTGGLVDGLLIVVCALVAPLAALRLRSELAAAVAIAAGLAYLMSAQLLFGAGKIVPVVLPLLALALALLGTAVVGRRRVPAAADAGMVALPPDEELGATLTDDAAEGDEIAGVRLEERIGGGGMGDVFRGEQPALARTVAVKVIAPALAADGRYRERFARESRLAAAIDHPHVLPIYDAGEDQGRLYLVMRYVQGADLGRRLGLGGPLDLETTAEVIAQVASALDAAHAHGLVHRDVKPANILIADRPAGPPHCYLADFGISRDLEASEDLTRTGALMGSVDYVAPEMVQEGRGDPAGDVYALGCVAFECLAGRPPFRRGSDVSTLWAHVNEPPPVLSDRLPAASVELDAVLARALAKDPQDRWPTCGALANALAGGLGGRAAGQARPTTS